MYPYWQSPVGCDDEFPNPCRQCPPQCPPLNPCCPSVYLTANNPQAGPVSPTDTNLAFSRVIASSPLPGGWQSYNAATGVFTVPMSGIYTITTHVGFNKSGTTSATDVSLKLKVNGVTISLTDEVIPEGVSKKWYDITIIYPLQTGQTVTVTASSSTANVLLIDPSSNFSLVRTATG